MVQNRQDAWTKDEDILLAETVLRFIREGKTQLEAFEDVAKQLSRTPAACGFRWNATVRKQYEKAIKVAKEERRNKEKESVKEMPIQNTNQEPFNFDEAIKLLQSIKKTYEVTNTSNDVVSEQLKNITYENEILKKKVEIYEKAWEEIERIWKDIVMLENKKQG
ncbi:RsfA family transcriptional regulator [Salirhabdus salicampi]|uniref:RsfA family transcriptional regulator n=1 Tax=Salirhabdus salicampi TaxID=476102 RepID=UPI0020C4FC76|nr:RsfA family transcriptional regulator [Salirhabdus salicampi]MCP8616617.1 RsfA family transcriptional regulator [Salirhabdus salicampi]